MITGFHKLDYSYRQYSLLRYSIYDLPYLSVSSELHFWIDESNDCIANLIHSSNISIHDYVFNDEFRRIRCWLLSVVEFVSIIQKRPYDYFSRNKK